jgi:pimeloyl-ACP methyl ester carboxylesterase
MSSTAAATISRRFVNSKDGTRIGYLVIGQGPGVVLLHGGGATSFILVKLAQGLADRFSVYVPDRSRRSAARTRACT